MARHVGREVLLRLAPGGDHQPILLGEQTVRVLERLVLDPQLQLIAFQLPDLILHHVGDEHTAVLVRGDVVQERGPRRLVRGGDLAARGVDHGNFVNVRDIEIAVMQREAQRGIQAGRPLLLKHLAFKRQLGDVAVTVGHPGLAIDVRDVEHTFAGIENGGFRTVQAFGLPYLLRLGCERARREQKAASKHAGNRQRTIVHRSPPFAIGCVSVIWPGPAIDKAAAPILDLGYSAATNRTRRPACGCLPGAVTSRYRSARVGGSGEAASPCLVATVWNTWSGPYSKPTVTPAR